MTEMQRPLCHRWDTFANVRLCSRRLHIYAAYLPRCPFCVQDRLAYWAGVHRAVMEPKTPRGAREMELRYPPDLR